MIPIVPHDAGYWRELGVELRRGGRLAEAVDALRRALDHAPRDAQALNELAHAWRLQGNLDEARGAASSALEIAPGLAGAWFNLGAVQVAQGETVRGIESYRKALELDPDFAEAWSNLGGALGASGDTSGEIGAYQRAVRIDPQLAPVWSNLGNALLEAGEIKDALSACKRAVELAPEFAAAWSNLGNALHEHGEHAEAVRACERALQLSPELAEAWSNLGCALLEQGAIEQSLAAHRRALELQPRNTRAYYNLGITHERCLQFEAAADSYQRAIEIDPAFTAARLKLAYVHLRRGDLSDGWAEYEWRWRDADAPAKRYDFASWNGDRRRGLKLLLWGEQGLGDRIIYASMIGELVEAGLRLTLETEPRLVTLMQRSFPGIQVVAEAGLPALARADFDVQAPLGSLGRWLRPSFDAFPKRTAYLKVDAKLAGMFVAKLRRSTPEKVVGISWRSVNREIGAYKSSTLVDWVPILKTPGFSFVDLQYGDTADAREDLRQRYGLGITHLDDVDLYNDLEALAALCEACDLVITVSNVTAHMAGALGKPVWLLVPQWRGVLWYWFSGRSDSLWYPSMRIFRQSEPGAWRPLLDQVADELSALATKR